MNKHLRRSSLRGILRWVNQAPAIAAASVLCAVTAGAQAGTRDGVESLPQSTVPRHPNQHANTAEAQFASVSEVPGSPGALSKQRFEELGFGLSFREPAATHKIVQTADGALVKYLFKNGSTFSFYIRRVKQTVSLKTKVSQGRGEQTTQIGEQTKPLTIGEIKQQAENQFAFAYPSANPVKDASPDVAFPTGKGLKLYFLVPNPKKGDWVAGQAFMLVTGRTVAMFQMRCNADQFKPQRALFEKLLQSVKLEDPRKLNKQRKAQLQRSEKWLGTITDAQVNKLVGPTQWFRLLDSGKDVGYRRLTTMNVEELGEKGVGVRQMQRLKFGKAAFVTAGDYFASRNGRTELWSLRSARYADSSAKLKLKGAGKLPKNEVWAETGLRSSDAITVTQQTPARRKTHHWQKPPHAYLSQVAAKLLMGLLPHQQENEFAFYAYDSNTGRLALRLVRVKPLTDGRFQVTVRATPDRAPRVSIYDAKGRLIEQRRPDGRILKRTTPQDLAKIWHIAQPPKQKTSSNPPIQIFRKTP